MSEGNWFTNVWLSALSLIVALAAILSGAYIQRLSVKENAQAQTELKRMELTFRPKQEGYTAFMKAVSVAYKSKTWDDAIDKLEEVDVAYSSLEPFLDKPTREAVTSKMYTLKSIATMIDSKKEIPGQMMFGKLQDELHEILVPALFDRR
jgi:hypothetical protein